MFWEGAAYRVIAGSSSFLYCIQINWCFCLDKVICLMQLFTVGISALAHLYFLEYTNDTEDVVVNGITYLSLVTFLLLFLITGISLFKIKLLFL